MKPRLHAMRAVIVKDLMAIRRSKGVIIPMIAVPALLLVVLPLLIGLAARSSADVVWLLIDLSHLDGFSTDL